MARYRREKAFKDSFLLYLTVAVLGGVSGFAFAVFLARRDAFLQTNSSLVQNENMTYQQSLKQTVYPDHLSPKERELRDLLNLVGKDGEVLVTLSDSSLITADGSYGILTTWINCVRKVQVSNFVIVALDNHTANAVDKLEAPYWRTDPVKLANSDRNSHGVSSQKFSILKVFLKLGYNVLLSDVDVVVIQNPFDYLYRDSDVEAMSDGFDNNTAYGWLDGVEDASMGWGRHAQTIRVFALNSGLFYIRSSPQSEELLDRIVSKLERRKLWDQSVFNEAIWLPAHNEYSNPHVRLRVMDFIQFMNSKTLFKFIRHDERYQDVKPVMVHVNFHPDKWERMKAIMEFYVEGKTTALDAFPDGSCWNPPCNR